MGLGASGFYIYEHLPDWALTTVPEIARQLSPDNRLYPNPKNLYVRLLAETGLIGFFVFIAFLFSVLGDALNALGSKTIFGRYLGIAGIFSWFAIALYNVTQELVCHTQHLDQFRYSGRDDCLYCGIRKKYYSRFDFAAAPLSARGPGVIMIVLSVGMPRAGSGWHYNLVHDLMKTTGCADARDIRERYRLQNYIDGSELQYRGAICTEALAGGFARVGGEYVCHQGACGTHLRFTPVTTSGPASHHVHLSRSARCHAFRV